MTMTHSPNLDAELAKWQDALDTQATIGRLLASGGGPVVCHNTIGSEVLADARATAQYNETADPLWMLSVVGKDGARHSRVGIATDHGHTPRHSVDRMALSKALRPKHFRVVLATNSIDGNAHVRPVIG